MLFEGEVGFYDAGEVDGLFHAAKVDIFFKFSK
jgi:hypothetical protein